MASHLLTASDWDSRRWLHPYPSPSHLRDGLPSTFSGKWRRDRGNSDTLLHSIRVNQLSQQDRNLCTTLVLGTLRWQRVLDAECRQFLARPDLTLPEDALLAFVWARISCYFWTAFPLMPPSSNRWSGSSILNLRDRLAW